MSRKDWSIWAVAVEVRCRGREVRTRSCRESTGGKPIGVETRQSTCWECETVASARKIVPRARLMGLGRKNAKIPEQKINASSSFASTASVTFDSTYRPAAQSIRAQ